jgi:TRAP-type C4-dicarboxylate transport system substrate-binding protein
MKKPVVLLLAAVLALVFVLPVQAAPLKLVAAHNQTSQENPYQYGMLKFKEVVEKLSNGETPWTSTPAPSAPTKTSSWRS